MELFCKTCKDMPLIRFSFIKEGKILVIIKCKCGKIFHDVSTFIADYTDILKTDIDTKTKNEPKIIHSDNNLIYFCETCFRNIYKELNSENEYHKHKDHKLIKLDKNKPLITKEEFEKITQKLKLAENKILNYLPEMRDMLLKDCKNDKERKEIEHLAEFNLYRNNLLLSFLKLVYNLYITHKKNNTLTYQIIHNLKSNCDYNLNKYNLDLKNICKERFVSFLKSCMILCCNSYINKIYENYTKDKEELKKLIFNLKPYKEEKKEENKEENKEEKKEENKEENKEDKIDNKEDKKENIIENKIEDKNDDKKEDKIENKKEEKKDDNKENKIEEKKENGQYQLSENTIFIDEIIKSNNSIYYGEKSKINNLAYGRGFLYCASGSHYFGYFKDDYFQSGYGKTINKNGSIYFGEFKDGVANGIGKFTTKTGNIYRGYWSDNKLNEIGFITWENGKSYNGEINKGIFNGIGELFFKSGNIYRGEFKNGRMDGTGTINYKNKKEYIGEFKEGNKSGYGIMKWPTEEKYEGSWEKDSFKFGEYFWPNGNIYLGNFKNDYVNGFGTFYCSALGTIETGIWKDGRRVDVNDKDTIPSTRYLSFL